MTRTDPCTSLSPIALNSQSILNSKTLSFVLDRKIADLSAKSQHRPSDQLDRTMCRAAQLCLAIVAVILTSHGTALAIDEPVLKVIQRPTFWIVGQWTRIVIETPDDCGQLDVTLPKGLALLDRWPFKPGDATQRFYSRATAPFKSAKLVFTSGKHKLALPVRVLSWERSRTSGSSARFHLAQSGLANSNCLAGFPSAATTNRRAALAI